MSIVVMTAMHEKMHQRASKKWQPDQHAEHVSPVLGEQKGSGDDQESEQHYAGSRLDRHPFSRALFMSGVVSRKHLPVPLTI
ncbi:hypothetical protein ACVIJ6_007809 [Bradyrhizobium sp. USDA 4369]